MDFKNLIKKIDELDAGDSKPVLTESKEVNEGIVVQADGEEAMTLLHMLKLAGQPAPQEPSCGCGMNEEDRDPTYANTPDETISSMDAAIPSGDDLHREKKMTKHGYQQGDNPLAMAEVKSIEGRLAKMFESMSKE